MLIRRLRIRCGDGSLFLLFPLALALQLFSELTEEEAIMDVTTILTIQAEAVKEKGPVAHFSVCLSCIPFNSATSKCVDNTTSLRVSSSLHMAAIALSCLSGQGCGLCIALIRPNHWAASVAQWLEHLSSKQCVVGSNPTRAALFSFRRKKSCLG